jgi:hypothetical protein
MPYVIAPLQASAQSDPAPIAVSSTTPRGVSRQKLEHLDHLSEIKLDFHCFLDGQPSEFDHLRKSQKPFGHLAHLAPFSFLRSNSHVFEFSTSGHLVVHLAT